MKSKIENDYDNQGTTKMRVLDLVRLIEADANILNQIDKELLYPNGWFYILARRPELESEVNWVRLQDAVGSAWAFLIEAQPQFYTKYVWGNNSGDAAYHMLRSNLSEELREEIVNDCTWDSLKDKDWWRLISNRPEYAMYCDWQRLSLRTIGELLEMHPDLSSYVNEETMTLLRDRMWSANVIV